MFDWSTYCDIEIAENAFISSCKLPRMTHSNSGPIISETRRRCATANWTVRKSTKNSAVPNYHLAPIENYKKKLMTYAQDQKYIYLCGMFNHYIYRVHTSTVEIRRVFPRYCGHEKKEWSNDERSL